MRNILVRLASLTTIAVLGHGCASTILVDGFEVHESSYRESEANVRRRAAYDLECAENELELRLLHADGIPKVPKQFGVAGCDRRSVYVYVPYTGWVLNTDERPDDQNTPSP